MSKPDSVRPDWKNARPNPHAGKIPHGDGWRRLDDDIAAAFPTSKDVNEALKALLSLRAVLPAAADGGATPPEQQVVVKVAGASPTVEPVTVLKLVPEVSP